MYFRSIARLPYYPVPQRIDSIIHHRICGKRFKIWNSIRSFIGNNAHSLTSRICIVIFALFKFVTRSILKDGRGRIEKSRHNAEATMALCLSPDRRALRVFESQNLSNCLRRVSGCRKVAYISPRSVSMFPRTCSMCWGAIRTARALCASRHLNFEFGTISCFQIAPLYFDFFFCLRIQLSCLI